MRAVRDRAQPVARAADGLDQAIAPTVIDLPSETPDVDLDDVRLRHEIGVPQGLDQSLLAKDLPRMTGEELEQGELAGGQPDLATTTPHTQGRWIQLEIGDVDPRRTVINPASPKRPNPGPELGHREGLGEIIVGATIQALDPVREVIEGGEHEDRRVEPAAPERCAHAEAIESREDHVEDDQLIWIGRGPFERLVAVTDDVDRVAIVGEAAADRVRDGRLVLDDENAQGSPP